jgi:hypothetical protein
VVGDLRAVLDVLLLKNLGGFLEKLHVNPTWDFPVFLRHKLCD